MVLTRLIRADNPGPMTLDGTNTYIISGSGIILVVDPGPDYVSHLSKVVASTLAAAAAAGRVANGQVVAGQPGAEFGPADQQHDVQSLTAQFAVVITHHHLDHCAGLQRFMHMLRVEAGLSEGSVVPIYAGRPALMPPGVGGIRGVADGDKIGAVQVLLTPGHTIDSLCLLGPGGELFSGDTILGRGSSVIDYPNGRLGDYFSTLRRLKGLVEVDRIQNIYPGHGDSVTDARGVLDAYLSHREVRLEQVRQGLQRAGLSALQVLDSEVALKDLTTVVYGEIAANLQRNPVDGASIQLWKSAQISLQAQLDYLVVASR